MNQPELDYPNYLWSCINCGKRISTFCDFHINRRPHCQECNAEMEPAVAPPQDTPTSEPDKCLACGSPDKDIRHCVSIDKQPHCCIGCRNPWHSTVSPPAKRIKQE